MFNFNLGWNFRISSFFQILPQHNISLLLLQLSGIFKFFIYYHYLYYHYQQELFNLAPYSAQSCSSCIANCIRHRFLITQFLATEAFGKNALADRRQSAGSCPLFVCQLSKMCQRCILRFNLTSYQSMVTIDFKLAEIKLESSGAYLPKLEKNLSQGFEIIDIFFVKMRF